MISLWLGIVGLSCLGILAGIPAILVGIRARRKAAEQPRLFGGKRLATAGVIFGALSPLTSLLTVIYLSAATKEGKKQISTGDCAMNLMSVGRAMQVYAIDHGAYPDNLLLLRGTLRKPERLWCKTDTNHAVSTNWTSTSAGNVSFELLEPGGTEAENQHRAVLRCPIHQSEWWGDGSIHLKRGPVIRAP